MSTGGSVTHANFKKRQLDHLLDVILEANGDDDHPTRRIADEYHATNVQDYININQAELDTMELMLMRSRNISFLSRISGSTGATRIPRIGMC